MPGLLKEIRKVYSAVNAEEIRAAANQNLKVGLMASDEESYRKMERFLVPPGEPEALSSVHRVDGRPTGEFDLILCEPGLPITSNGYRFDPDFPAPAVSLTWFMM